MGDIVDCSFRVFMSDLENYSSSLDPYTVCDFKHVRIVQYTFYIFWT